MLFNAAETPCVCVGVCVYVAVAVPLSVTRSLWHRLSFMSASPPY